MTAEILRKKAAGDTITDEVALRADIAVKILKRVEVCQMTFTASLQGYMPKLWQARQINKTFRRIFRYCDTSWRDGAAALRQELVDVSREWPLLMNPPASTNSISSSSSSTKCSYQPTEAEISKQKEDYEEFETRNEFKVMLSHHLQSQTDGWLPNDVYEASKKRYREMYEDFLEEIRSNSDSDSAEKEKMKLSWPFDPPDKLA